MHILFYKQTVQVYKNSKSLTYLQWFSYVGFTFQRWGDTKSLFCSTNIVKKGMS